MTSNDHKKLVSSRLNVVFSGLAGFSLLLFAPGFSRGVVRQRIGKKGPLGSLLGQPLGGFSLFVVLLLAAAATAQDSDIKVDIRVNHSFAYRAATWVPVDVFVKNDKRDFTGWVEIRAYEGGELGKPIYRLPVDCPKSSLKRFQLCCFLDKATRIEAHLYDGRRELLKFPPWLDVKPIENEALLGMVCDEDGSGFGFLNQAVNLATGGERRFYREVLPTEELPFLAQYPQCYSPYDIVILGNCDPERIGERQRAVLRDYVRDGGTLVVCTGEYWAKYHGTWVEELLGVTIGPVETLKEQAAAQAFFAAADQEGAKDYRECLVATLTPTAPDIKRYGAAKTLATRRPMGNGFVYAFAVDADSRALQECLGYLKLWRGLALSRMVSAPLNYEEAGQFASNILPQMAGIVIHSRQSVMIYLGLYFCIAIVGNWLFFSRKKRREWAWAMLIVFSIGFTGYAVVFGTTGIRSKSELDQIQVMRVPVGGELAKLQSYIGPLNSRSTTYSFKLERDGALARDIADAYSDPYRGGTGVGISSRPFYLIEGDKPRVEGFSVGASEIRLLRTESDIPVQGGVDGRVELTSDGKLKADVTNNTGLKLEKAGLFLDGQIFPLEASADNGFHAEVANYRSLVPYEDSGKQGRANRPYNVSGAPGSKVPIGFWSHELQENLPRCLFAGEGGVPASVYFSQNYGYGYQYGNQWGGGRFELADGMGPFLFAWVSGRLPAAITLDRTATTKVDEMLLIADVAIACSEDIRFRWRKLNVVLDSSKANPLTRSGVGLWTFGCRDTVEVYLVFPEDLLDQGIQDVLVEMEFQSQHNHAVVFAPKGAEDTWSQQHRVVSEQPGASNPYSGAGMTQTAFQIGAWQNYLMTKEEALLGDGQESLSRRRALEKYLGNESSDTGTESKERFLIGTVKIAPGSGTRCQGGSSQVNTVIVTAKAKVPLRRVSTGDESLWQ